MQGATGVPPGEATQEVPSTFGVGRELTTEVDRRLGLGIAVGAEVPAKLDESSLALVSPEYSPRGEKSRPEWNTLRFAALMA